MQVGRYVCTVPQLKVPAELVKILKVLEELRRSAGGLEGACGAGEDHEVAGGVAENRWCGPEGTCGAGEAGKDPEGAGGPAEKLVVLQQPAELVKILKVPESPCADSFAGPWLPPTTQVELQFEWSTFRTF